MCSERTAKATGKGVIMEALFWQVGWGWSSGNTLNHLALEKGHLL